MSRITGRADYEKEIERIQSSIDVMQDDNDGSIRWVEELRELYTDLERAEERLAEYDAHTEAENGPLNQALVEAAVKAYHRLKAKEPTIEPEDGLVWALEENDHLYPYGLTHKLHARYVAAVAAACKGGSQPAEYEQLPDNTLNDAHGDFRACEYWWNPASAKDAQKLVEAAKAVMDVINPDTPCLDWASAKEAMGQGRAVHTPIGYIREKTDYPKCPLCGSSIIGLAALSRIDNKTAICNGCGEREAFEDFTDTIDG